MVTIKREIGDLGEAIACRYLEGKGYEVVDRNYLKVTGEIDIVARMKGKYHFIEVKTVTREKISRVTGELVTNELYRAEENLHTKKIERVLRTAQIYLLENRLQDSDWQIDAVTVTLESTSKRAVVEMISNIGV